MFYYKLWKHSFSYRTNLLKFKNTKQPKVNNKLFFYTQHMHRANMDYKEQFGLGSKRFLCSVGEKNIFLHSE